MKLYSKYPPSTFYRLHPSEYFIVAEISLSALKLALHALKKSIWWNVYGFFIIQRIHLNSCNEAYEYLKIVWNFNILSAIFVCMDSESKIQIHTFNPSSDYASVIWTKYKTVRQSNGHPWVLFKYIQNSELMDRKFYYHGVKKS